MIRIMWLTYQSSLLTLVSHHHDNIKVKSISSVLVKSPSLASHSTLLLSLLIQRRQEGEWQLGRNTVPLMNNLSVYFWVTQWGLNQGAPVMFFHNRRLSGEVSPWRTSVPAVCPAELSPRPQPEAWWHVRESVIISIWHMDGNHFSWTLISWHFKCLNCCD